MSARILMLLCLLAVCLTAQQEQGSIRGTVVLRRDGAPLHNATVRAVQLRRTVETGPDGSFEFTNVPPGTYDVVAHMQALTDESQTVRISAGESAQVTFRLSIAALRQQVTVTASGQEETALETFQSVTSLDNQRLTLESQSPSLGDMLQNEPGIAKRSFGPGTSRPVVRGFDGDRVLVLQDGGRSGTLSSQSGDHGEPVDPMAIERVEVVRGPATLLYGSGAMGGVVNIITRHHEMHEHPHPGIRGSVAGVAGSGNGQAGTSGTFEYGAGDYLLWGSGGGTRTGDYSTPIGEVPGSATDMQHAELGLGRYHDRISVSGSYGLQQGTYGVPFAAMFEEHEEQSDLESGAHEEEQVKLDWRRHRLRAHVVFHELSRAFEHLRLTANYTDWNHKEMHGGEIGTQFYNRQSNWQAVFEQRRAARWSGSLGVWGLHRSYKALGEEALAPPVGQNGLAVFALEQLSLERVRFQFGARLEHNRYSPQRDAPVRNFTGFSGSAGVNVPLSPSSAFVFNYTHTHRAPAIEELYNRGPHVGNLTYEIGNPLLSGERGNGLEAAIRRQSRRVRSELSGFYYRFSNFVYLAPAGTFEGGLPVAEYGQAKTRYMGLEARMDTVLHPYVTLNLSADAVDAQIREGGPPLPRIPPFRGRIAVDLHSTQFSVRPEIVLSNRQDDLFPGETPTAGYALFNITGNYTRASQHTMHVLSVVLFNATDRLYRNHLSFIKEFAPEIGRGVRVAYTLHFF